MRKRVLQVLAVLAFIAFVVGSFYFLMTKLDQVATEAKTLCVDPAVRKDRSVEQCVNYMMSYYHINSRLPKVGVVAASPVSAKVPEWTWVTVKNPNGVDSGNAHHAFNDQCGIMEGGELRQVKIVGDEVLVLYISPRGQGFGSECGNETIFFVYKATFNTMSARYKAIIDAREVEKNKIRALLK